MINVLSGLSRRGRNVAFRCLFLLVLVWAAGLSHAARAQAIKGEVSVTLENGYARLVFLLAEEVDAQTRIANNIVTVTFAKPVDVPVDRLSVNGQGYISAARRDPDGKAVRIALARKVTMNSMAAGERLFVDLMPDGWVGLPPGLPREVIEDLTKRARDAERKQRQQRTIARQTAAPPSRVRVVVQPTFTRYVFDLPELTAVAADNAKDKLTLTFDSTVTFDLADAKAALPPSVASIESEAEQDSVTVRFNFADKVDVRTFREDLSFVVDVTPMEAKPVKVDGSVRSDELAAVSAELAARGKAPPAGVEPPKTIVTPQPGGDNRVEGKVPAVPDKDEAAVPPIAETQLPAQPQPQPSAQMQTPPAIQDEGRTAGGVIKVAVKRNVDNVALTFAFAAETPAAIFRRGDAVWFVFDTESPISLFGLEAETGRSIKSATVTRVRNTAIVRLKLDRPLLVSAAMEGPVWTVTLGSEVVEATRPLAINRNVLGAARSSISIPFDDPRNVHRLEDPDAGDLLLVATALGPARGFLKAQEFVELRILPSTQGIVVQPLADDLDAELAADRVVISRPTGLTLSPMASGGPVRKSAYQRNLLDAQSWGFDRQADFIERKTALVLAAADAPESKRFMARTDLARFYLARDMAPEAKAVLDVALADAPATSENPSGAMLHAVCTIMMGRAEAGLKELANPFVANQSDTPLWRAMANARLGRWVDAREGFRNAEAAMGALPLELQRMTMMEMLRSAIEVGDITGASSMLHEFETIGVPHELEPAIAVLTGRLNEGLGRKEDARRAYNAAADSWDRPSVAQGRLRDIVLRQSLGEVKRTDAIAELETLTAIWRGDATEVEALQMLARLYTEEGRYRDAFQIMRTAIHVHPNSEMTRRIQEDAAATFDGLFLAGKGDALPAIEALALFYDFRELTPIGRRGDEMIRRLADRLVSVDLLYQAGELLQHQVDHRMQGAARAQVASRLAVIYLMDHKPEKALATLRATRIGELNNELRNQRLLLEARALSETKRHDLAIEVIENIRGREAIRLRADIYWAAKRWNQAAEQIELLYGNRWQDFAPLTETERADILRGAIGYSLAEDTIGLTRFRDKYAAKMGDGPDHRAFEVITTPVAVTGGEFSEIARQLASADTLESFLRDMRARYPETGALPAAQPSPASGAAVRPGAQTAQNR